MTWEKYNQQETGRPDPEAAMAAMAAAKPAIEQPIPPTEPKRVGLTVQQLEQMRMTQKLFNTAELSKRGYVAWQIEEFLASRWNLEWTPSEESKPLSVEEIAASHTHQRCGCEICARLVNAGFRPITDEDTGTKITWQRICEPKVEPPKVELPLHPDAAMLPDCHQCDHYGCRNKRQALQAAGFYFNPYENGGEWRRLGS